jgi:hypothetical protein
MVYLEFYSKRLTLPDEGGIFQDFVEDFPSFSWSLMCERTSGDDIEVLYIFLAKTRVKMLE